MPRNRAEAALRAGRRLAGCSTSARRWPQSMPRGRVGFDAGAIALLRAGDVILPALECDRIKKDEFNLAHNLKSIVDLYMESDPDCPSEEEAILRLLKNKKTNDDYDELTSSTSTENDSNNDSSSISGSGSGSGQ